MTLSASRRVGRFTVVAGTIAAILWAGACTDDQPPWCEDLESLGDLSELSEALASSNGEQVAEELDRFDLVASDAPGSIKADMEAISAALTEAVEIALEGDLDQDALELRREAANQQLARMPDHISAVSGWAEEECGIHLD